MTVHSLHKQAPRNSSDDTARSVALMHETAGLAYQRDLHPAPAGRLAVLMESVGSLATAVLGERDDLRVALLDINVQTQLWLNEIDRDNAA